MNSAEYTDSFPDSQDSTMAVHGSQDSTTDSVYALTNICLYKDTRLSTIVAQNPNLSIHLYLKDGAIVRIDADSILSLCQVTFSDTKTPCTIVFEGVKDYYHFIHIEAEANVTATVNSTEKGLTLGSLKGSEGSCFYVSNVRFRKLDVECPVYNCEYTLIPEEELYATLGEQVECAGNQLEYFEY